MLYKSSVLTLGLIVLSMGRSIATENPASEANNIPTPNLSATGIEPTVTIASEPTIPVVATPQPPALLTAELTIAPTPNFAPTADPTLREAWNPELDPAKTLSMGFVTPLSDVLTIEPKIAQTPESPTPAPEPKKWAVGIHTQASTTGFFGVDGGYKFSPNLHARLGINTIGFGYNYSSQGIDYKASVSPTNVHLLGDYFPFGGGLRVTGGFVFQNNRFSGSAKSDASNQININGTNYDASQIGTVETSGSFSNSVAPYLGIGFGTPISEGFGFNIDAGVMFAGSPTVSLSANNVSPAVPVAVQNQLRSDLATQQQKTNADIKNFNIYPVLSIGFSYAF
jgi:hypothetical protein